MAAGSRRGRRRWSASRWRSSPASSTARTSIRQRASHPCHICTRTGPTPATSAPGAGLQLRSARRASTSRGFAPSHPRAAMRRVSHAASGMATVNGVGGALLTVLGGTTRVRRSSQAGGRGAGTCRRWRRAAAKTTRSRRSGQATVRPPSAGWAT
jgi:hypothetical protein